MRKTLINILARALECVAGLLVVGATFALLLYLDVGWRHFVHRHDQAGQVLCVIVLGIALVALFVLIVKLSCNIGRAMYI